jgi:long-chain acyl-CoA synthetase
MYPVAPVRKIRIAAVYHSSVVPRDTLIDFFSDLSHARGEFLVYDDGFRSRGYSYHEVVRAAHAFAAQLHDLGVRKGDKIVFWSENRPEWIVAFWGCLLRGIIVVPIDYRASPDFLARVVGLVAAKLVLIGQDVPQFTAAIDPPVWKLHEFAWPPAAAPAPADLPPEPIGRDDVAEIIFTSGATADPKGVVITHRNVLANIVPVEREVLKYRKWGTPFFPLRFLNLLPLSHMFGQAMATFIPPMLPGVVVFMRGYNPGEVVEQIRKRRISVVVSVPKILDVLKDHVTRSFGEEVEDVARRRQPSAKKEHFTLRWWRYRRIHRAFGMKFWAFIVGAAPLDPPLEAFWSELGFVVIQGYGLTETAPIVTLNHPFGTKKGSVGKAIAGVEMKIAPDGEILVRGENVTRGYFNASEETAQAFEDGWFRTGDIGEIGEDRQLYIRGRKKEMIVTPEGLNVFPEDVERVVNQIAGVREAAVVGVPIGSEERVHAVIVLEKSGASTDPESVARQANAVLDDHQKIRRVVVWPESGPASRGGGRRCARGAGRQVRRPHRSVAADDARGAGAQLARTGRVDGGARRRV